MYSFERDVLVFLLLFQLHLRRGTCKHLEFHCQFDDSDFNLVTGHYEGTQYGKEPEGVTGNIQTNFNKIFKIYTQFLAPGVIYNGIDSYIQFYRYFKTARDHCNTLPLPAIIQNFNVSIYPDEENVGYIITLMRRIAAKEPSLAAASYLVTASQYRHETYGNVRFDSPENYSDWTYSRVAGVIKLKDKKSGRLCYVLLDPRVLEFPVAVMETGEDPPLKRFGMPRESGEWFYRHLAGPYDYAADVPVHLLWYNKEHKDYNRTRTESNFIAGHLHAYYFKRPYCSFVNQTVKPTLLELRRVLVKMTAITYEAVIVFAENWVVKNETKCYAKLVLNNGINVDRTLFPKVKEEMSLKLKNMTGDLNLLCTALGVKTNTESCRMKWIRRIKDLKEISEDKDFLFESFLKNNRSKYLVNTKCLFPRDLFT